VGHPSVQKLQSIVYIEFSVSNLGCESCELDKHYRATYQRRVNNRNSSTFKLVHLDVWSPNRVLSLKGFRYFLIFIDEFSHDLAVFTKSEFFDVIELFFNEIKIQFSIRMLHTDNALKHVKNDVPLLCFKNEIIHQTFCSHTSQQNGIAERKHTHSRCY